jgi:hypothetical protein
MSFILFCVSSETDGSNVNLIVSGSGGMGVVVGQGVDVGLGVGVEILVGLAVVVIVAVGTILAEEQLDKINTITKTSEYFFILP